MKLIKIASGKTKIKISKQEWINIGKQAAWYHEPETDKYAGKGTFDITVYLDENEVYQPSTPDSPEGIKATAIYTYYPPEKSTSSYPGYPEHIQINKLIQPDTNKELTNYNEEAITTKYAEYVIEKHKGHIDAMEKDSQEIEG